MLELDHLMVFRPGPEGVDGHGLVLDEGTRHVGQGTRNRRIVFPDSYVELLWVEAATQEPITVDLKEIERRYRELMAQKYEVSAERMRVDPEALRNWLRSEEPP